MDAEIKSAVDENTIQSVYDADECPYSDKHKIAQAIHNLITKGEK